MEAATFTVVAGTAKTTGTPVGKGKAHRRAIVTGSLPGAISILPDPGKSKPERSGTPLRRQGLPAVFSSFASSIETAFVGAVRDQAERTTSSWVTRALDTLASVVSRALMFPSGGQTQPTPSTEVRSLAAFFSSPVFPQASAPKARRVSQASSLLS